MNHKRVYVIVGVIVAVVVGLYALFVYEETGGDENSSALMEFHDIDMREEKDGKLVWKLKAHNVKMETNRNIVRLEGVEGYFSDGGNELEITADTGVLNRKEKSLRLEGHIKGKTKDGILLEARNLTYDGQKEILRSDEYFMFEKDGRTLSADSFTADRVLETIEAKGHAKLSDKEDS